MEYISLAELEALGEELGKSDYGKYLLELAREEAD
jgi:hypothetical protein